MSTSVERLEAQIDVDASKASASLLKWEAMVKATTRDQTQQIKVDIDRSSLDRARSALDFLRDSFSRGGGDGGDPPTEKIKGLGDAAGRATPRMRGLGIALKGLLVVGIGAAISPVITLITALGGAVVGLTSALRPLVGVLATVPQGISILGQVITTALLSFGGIKEALQASTAATKASVNPAKMAADEAERLADAQRQVELAHRAVAEASDDLGQALQDVGEAQAELNRILSESNVQEELTARQQDAEQASINLARATMNQAAAVAALEKLLHPIPGTQDEITSAELDLADAQERLNEVLRAGSVDMAALERAERDLGVDLSDLAYLFRSAAGDAEDLARAQIGVRDSEKALEKLRNPTVGTAEELAAANLDVQQTNLDLVRATEDAADATEELTKFQRDGIKGTDAYKDALTNLVTTTDIAGRAEVTLKDAHYNLGEAIEGLAKPTENAAAAQETLATALAALTPAGRAFVEFIQNELKPRIQELKDIAQENLLPGLQEGMRLALPLFGPLKLAIAGTALALGDIATEFGRVVGSPFFQAAFTTIAESNERIIRLLGGAAIELFKALTNVMVAAAPLTEWMAGMIANWATLLATWTGSEEGANKMSEWFGPGGSVQTALTQVFTLFGNIAGAINGVLTAAAPLGQWVMDNLVQLTGRWETWTKGEGKDKMTKFFDDLKPVLTETARLFGAIVEGWFGLINNPKTAEMIETLRVDLLPVILDLVKQFQDSGMAQTFLDILVDLAEITLSLAKSGALQLLVQLVGLLVKGISLVAGTSVGGALLAFLGAFKLGLMAVNLGGKLFLTNFTKFKLFPTLFKILMGVVRPLLPLFGAIGGAIAAIPLGIALLVAALIAAVVLIFFHWEKVLQWFKDLPGRIVGALDYLWEQIKDIFMAIWEGLVGHSIIPDLIDAIVGFFAGLPQRVLDAIVGLIGMLFDTGKKILQGLLDGVKWIWEHSIIGWLWGRKGAILGFFDTAWDWLWEVGKKILQGLKDGIVWLWDHSIVRWLWDRKSAILGFFVDAFNWLGETGRTILRGLWSGVQWVWHHIILPGFRIWEWFWNIFSNASDWLVGMGKDIIIGLWNGIVDKASWLAVELVKLVKNIIPGPIAKLLGISSPSKMFRGFGQNVMQGLALGIDDEASRAAHSALAAVQAVTAEFGKLGGPAMDAQLHGLWDIEGGRPLNVGAITLAVDVSGSTSPEETAEMVGGQLQSFVPALLRELRSR